MALTAAVTSGASAASAATIPSRASVRPRLAPIRSIRETSCQLVVRLTAAPRRKPRMRRESGMLQSHADQASRRSRVESYPLRGGRAARLGGELVDRVLGALGAERIRGNPGVGATGGLAGRLTPGSHIELALGLELSPDAMELVE